MPKFESPLGTKTFAGQPMREFDVPDENDPGMNPVMSRRGPALHGSQLPTDIDAAIAFQQRMNQESPEEVAEIERSMREARDARRSGKVRLNEGARRRIEMLVGMSRTTRDFEIDGNKYSLQTLSSKEMRTAILEASAFDGSVQSPFEVRRQFLAYSLTQVAGLDIVQFVGTNDMAAKLELIDSLDEALLNRIYDEYLTMVNEARVKYTIKSEEDVKEVMEDLKK